MNEIRLSDLSATNVLSASDVFLVSKKRKNGDYMSVKVLADHILDYVIQESNNRAKTQNKEKTKLTPYVPPGIISPWAGTYNKVPAGWLICDGSSYLRSDYTELSDILGNNYGITIDDTKYFKVPDLRGRTIVGLCSQNNTYKPDFGNWNSSAEIRLGSQGGEYNHRITISELPAHNHEMEDLGHSHQIPGAYDEFQSTAATKATIAGGSKSANFTTDTTTSNISIANTGGNSYHNNMQPFSVVNYIIKF